MFGLERAVDEGGNVWPVAFSPVCLGVLHRLSKCVTAKRKERRKAKGKTRKEEGLVYVSYRVTVLDLVFCVSACL